MTYRLSAAVLLFVLAYGQIANELEIPFPIPFSKVLRGGNFSGCQIPKRRTNEAAFQWNNRGCSSDSTRDPTDQPDKVLDALNIPQGATVADVGAGAGYFTWRLAERVGPAGKVIAEEIQQEMVDALARETKQRRVTNVEIVLGGVRDPHLPENAVDLALLVHVYHEFIEPDTMISRIRHALKPDGRLVVIEYRKEDPSLTPLGAHRMTVEELRSGIEPLGFKLQRVLDVVPTQHTVIFTKRKGFKQEN